MVPDYLFPNYQSGSDHVSLVADFELVDAPEDFVYPEDRKDLAEVGSWWWWVAGVGGAIAVVVITMICWKYAGPEKKRRAESSSTSVD